MFLFHNIEFILFFILLFILYWRVSRVWQNILLLFASLLFYCSWNWHLIWVMGVSTTVDYFCGLGIYNNKGKIKKAYLSTSILVNLGLLFYFKYSNFFITSFKSMFQSIGIYSGLSTLDIVLPLGISFYTFQTMSYSLDIYRGSVKPTKNFLDFSLFVTFFPQLIAGPIEKSKNLLPQIISKRNFEKDDLKKGFYLFAYGLFLKVALATPIEIFLENISNHYPKNKSIYSIFLLYGYAMRIYFDFSGYSKMARGLAKILGFNLMRNFYLPFHSTGYVDFYKRWHISLSKWIGEYVYMPLFYWLNRRRAIGHISNIKIRMLLVLILTLFITRMIFAVWHGASESYIYLGLFIFSAQLISMIVGPFLKRFKGNLYFRIFQSFLLVNLFSFAMLFFQDLNIDHISTMLKSFYSGVDWMLLASTIDVSFLLGIVTILVYDTYQYIKDDEFAVLKGSALAKGSFAFLFIAGFLFAENAENAEFIYFQF